MVTGAAAAAMEVQELFTRLESNQPHEVEEAKKRFHENFNLVKEGWLLNGLFDYYLSTNSYRAIEILTSVREPHDAYLFHRLCEAVKGPNKLQALTLLGHVLRREPAWLYKIAQHPLLKELLKLLKTDTDIIPLMSALLVIIILLPMIPALVEPFLPDIFEIFSRLAAWNCTEDQLVHLQVAMYALFVRLYGMYPCNFVSYLRNHYRAKEQSAVFTHTIKPMLETVKMHPHLIIASKDQETATARWKKTSHHDVILQCEKYTLDVSRDDSCYSGLMSSIRSKSDAGFDISNYNVTLDNIRAMYTSTEDDSCSPSMFFKHPTTPLPETSVPTSIPQTPNSLQGFVVSGAVSATAAAASTAYLPHQEGTSPPEAAIEATPETTPIKDSRTSKTAPTNTNVVRAINANVIGKWGMASGMSTPVHSQPSSPMKKEMSPFRFPDQASAFELPRKDVPMRESVVSQKISKLMHERSQINDSPVDHRSISNLKTRPLTHPTSPLRVISSTDSSVPNSPVPIETSANAAREWQVARPRPEKNGVRLESPVTTAAECSQEDQEVLQIVQQGEQFRMGTGSVQKPRLVQCDSVLQEFHTTNDEEYEECEQGSPCTSGGLHMPNSRSVMDFTRRMSRIRFHSQCRPDTVSADHSENSTGSSPGNVVLFPTNVKVRRANSCPEMKKGYIVPPVEPIGRALDESDELNIDGLTSVPARDESPTSNGYEEPTGDAKEYKTISTQTTDCFWPYEHLFLGVFPSFDAVSEIRPSPSPSPATILAEAQKSVRFSPYDMLDRYIECAVQGTDRSTRRVQTVETRLREQLELVQLHLQFERHRREVHAVRNRRLLGETRNISALEEYNSALRDQLKILQTEIESLHRQLDEFKQKSQRRENELHDSIAHWRNEYTDQLAVNQDLREKNVALQREMSEHQQKIGLLSIENQKANALLFEKDNEMQMALEHASASERVRLDLELTQRQLLLTGELLRKYREKMSEMHPLRYKDDEFALQTENYNEEIKSLNNHLETRTLALEACRSRISELEHIIIQHEELSVEQKRLLKEVKDEYHEQLKAMESKYNTLRAINRNMEERMLELWQRIDASIPDTSSCVEAGPTDRTSATTGLSPHSSPLSASLASSEGSTAFLHSSSLNSDMKEIKNLQVIVDQPETVRQNPVVSEVTPEDGAKPSSSAST